MADLGTPRGRGRPPIGDPVQVRLPQDLVDWLDSLGGRLGGSRAEAIRAVLTHVREHKCWPPERR